ncbi:MAG TPA: hypothetical protein VFZ99_06700 [Terriglobales bacterium]
MVDPAIDAGNGPFSYFSQPTDVIGVMDGRAGTLVSPEGYLYTGYGELVFFTGSPLHPAAERIKTLDRGYLPVIEYTFKDNGVEYRVTAFAATLDGNPESPLMNFIRVRMVNTAATSRLARFAVGMRYTSPSNIADGVGDNRFQRPATPKRLGDYSQPGVEWNPDWEYRFIDDGFVRDGRLMYLFPTTPKPVRSLTLKERYNGAPHSTPRQLHIQPTTPAGIVQYELPLTAGSDKVLEFHMPYGPLPLDSPVVSQLRGASFDEYLKHTEEFWESIFSRGLEISVPEAKVNDAFRANLVYDLIARDKVGTNYVQTVNKFHYHAFWLRDSSYIARMYDLSGYHDFAGQVLDFFPGWQQPDGNFVSQGGQFDGWGQVMWAYGQHYRITKDRAFAERVYPSMQRALAWLRQARSADPLHLIPATTPGDNEDITGHVTGHNFWALAGLKNVIAVADALGRSADAKAYRAEYDDYKSALLAALKKATASTGGYMPPGLDKPGGQDWGNMLSVYPEQVLDPSDPMVTATLEGTRAKYQEGIMTYGDGRWLHHYLTFKNTETEIIRGEQQHALQEIYAVLLHTSSTHAGFEFCIFPWGTRDFAQNLSPHGWFAAKFRSTLRNMMVREENRDLHLLSVISPEWVKPGQSIRVHRAPTNFGQVNFDLEFSESMATLRMENKFTEAPRQIVLHLPWFMKVSRIVADGKSLESTGNSVRLPAGARQVSISWSKPENVPALSYANAVNAYKAEYRRRYEQWSQAGTQQNH